MIADIYIFIWLAVHLILFVLMLVLVLTDIMKISLQLLWLDLFIPIFGFLMVITGEILFRSGKNRVQNDILHRFLFDSEDYRTLELNDKPAENEVVPLEEALLINDATVSRSLIIGLLEKNSADNIALFQKARLHENADVAHYASTAIMEIQRKYDLELQSCDKRLDESPGDITVLDEYLKAIKEYIDSGLLSDQIKTLQRVRYAELIRHRIELSAENAESLYEYLADNLLELGHPDDASAVLDTALAKWSENERLWILKLKYFRITGRGDMIRRTLSEIEQREIYISPDIRRQLNFWLETETEKPIYEKELSK